MQSNHPYYPVVNHFSSQPVVTLATGATCAFLGDERSLREHLITAEAARHLRAAGHTVIHFFIDDNLDPLNFRQLRVAVNKNPDLIERYQEWCGRPIAYLPDPWGCCESYAAHFEEELTNRLHYVGCHPTLIRVSKLYERGLYRSAVRTVLENPGKIRSFLQNRFPEYIPEKLFWPICPHCRYIDATTIEGVHGEEVTVSCGRCRKDSVAQLDSIPGKLNWKLDCAARWPLFHIDGEAFSQPYLEPHVGSYRIAQALSLEFFGGHTVFPMHYGLVKMEKHLGGKLLDSLPPKLLRDVFVESPATDIVVSRDSLVSAASRHQVQPDYTYLDFIKQVLPIWLMTQHALTWKQRELTKHAISFGKEFLDIEAHPHLPQREAIEDAEAETLRDLSTLLQKVFEIRQSSEASASQAALTKTLEAPEAMLALQNEVKSCTNSIGANKKAVLQRFRAIVGQEHGLPVTKLLLLLPLDYLQLLMYLIELVLQNPGASPDAQNSLQNP